jgi:hypothetical protein
VPAEGKNLTVPVLGQTADAKKPVLDEIDEGGGIALRVNELAAPVEFERR